MYQQEQSQWWDYTKSPHWCTHDTAGKEYELYSLFPFRSWSFPTLERFGFRNPNSGPIMVKTECDNPRWCKIYRVHSDCKVTQTWVKINAIIFKIYLSSQLPNLSLNIWFWNINYIITFENSMVCMNYLLTIHYQTKQIIILKLLSYLK